MKKKILGLGLCVLLLTGCGEIAKLENGQDAVVTFEKGNAISADNLYEDMKNKYAISVLVDMIDEQILAKEYPNSGEDKEAYVKNYIDAFKANFKDDATYLQAMKYYYGANNETELKETVGVYYMKDLATTDYAKTLVTNKEIKAYYEEKTKGDIKCSHILITPETKDDMTDKEKAAADTKALNEAKAIIKQLDESKDVTKLFASLAKEKSDDTVSAKDNGNLGYFNTGKMYEEFETAAYALKKGEYSKTPVKTAVGYHIILKVDAKAKPSLEDAKDTIIETLATEKKTADTTLQIEALVELREKYGMKIEDSELNKQYKTYIKNLKANAEQQ